MFTDLLDALSSGNDTVRGHAADALERVSRLHPAIFSDYLDPLLSQVIGDPVPMVRWHLAMLIGNLAICGEGDERLVQTLIKLLDNCSSFVKCWAISSLCLVGRRYPQNEALILENLAPLQQAASIAVRQRAYKAVSLLMNPQAQPPRGWLKIASGAGEQA